MKTVLLYSLDGCPWCDELKDLLNSHSIEYVVRDIEKHDEEWENIKKETKNEFVPAVCILHHDKKMKEYILPDIHFEDVEECTEKVLKVLGY